MAVLIGFIAWVGCGRTEWNWDWAWWKSPRRIVPPTRPNPERPPPMVQKDADLDAPARADASPERSTPAEQTLKSRQAQRPFYQLYLVSAQGSSDSPRGESRVALQHADARSCASLLELLVIPTGRSGSPDECYLLYEDRGEFERATRLAPLLDVRPLRDALAGDNPEDAFLQGVGMMLALTGDVAIIEAARIVACEKLLVEAMQAHSLSMTHRWVAGVLAGHLMSDYRYDYETARRYFSQTERLSETGSIEQLTAMYWRADALRQGGQPEEAAELYRRLVEQHGAAAGIQIVSLSRAALKEKRR